MESNLACAHPSRMNAFMWRIQEFLKESAYRLRLSKRPKGYTVLHAEREFRAAGYVPLDQAQEDGPNKWIQQNVVELLEVFGRQGHSGFSAPHCVEMFRKLALHEPLVPLSGADDEWNEVGDGVFQNNRCSHVFKQADRFNGQAYDINGRIFREPSGACYTGRESCIPVTFPYTPTREYVDVPACTDDGK